MKHFSNSPRLWLCISVLIFSFALRTEAQTGKRPFGYEQGDSVEVDLGTGRMSSPYLPFDVGFRLTGNVAEGIVEIQAFYSEITNDSIFCNCNCEKVGKVGKNAKVEEVEKPVTGVKPPCDCDSVKPCTPLCSWKSNILSKGRFFIDVPPLPPNRHYRFCFKVIRFADSSETAAVAHILADIADSILNNIMFSELRLVNGDNVNSGMVWNALENSRLDSLRAKFNNEMILYTIHRYGVTDPQVLAAMTNLPMLDPVNSANHYRQFRTLLMDDANAIEPLVQRRKAYSEYTNGGEKRKICDTLYRIHEIPFVTTLIDKKIKFKDAKKLSDQLDSLVDFLAYKNNRNMSDKGMLAFFSGAEKENMLEESLGTLQDVDSLIANYKASIIYIQRLKSNLKEFSKINEKVIEKNKQEIDLLEKELTNAIARFQSQNKSLEKLKNAIIARKGLEARISKKLVLINDLGIRLPVGGITSADFLTRNQWYITADAGLLVAIYGGSAFQVKGTILPYYGVNFNFLPINRNADYSVFRRRCNPYQSCYNRFSKNLSGVIGLTAMSAANSDRDNTWIDKDYSLVTGVGLRLTSALRFSTGAIWTEQHAMNPLLGNTHLRASLYVSLSLDLDLIDYTKKAGALIFQ